MVGKIPLHINVFLCPKHVCLHVCVCVLLWKVIILPFFHLFKVFVQTSLLLRYLPSPHVPVLPPQQRGHCLLCLWPWDWLSAWTLSSYAGNNFGKIGYSEGSKKVQRNEPAMQDAALRMKLTTLTGRKVETLLVHQSAYEARIILYAKSLEQNLGLNTKKPWDLTLKKKCSLKILFGKKSRNFHRQLKKNGSILGYITEK